MLGENIHYILVPGKGELDKTDQCDPVFLCLKKHTLSRLTKTGGRHSLKNPKLLSLCLESGIACNFYPLGSFSHFG